MQLKHCLKCNTEVGMFTPECPSCGGKSFTYDSKSNLTTNNLSTSSPRLSSNFDKKNISNSARIAIESARIVNAYGTYLQIVGIVLGIIIIIGGFFFAQKSHSVVFAVSGLIIGLIDLAIFAVQGAIFRMVYNYVIARLE
jgi:hypothetical protein